MPAGVAGLSAGAKVALVAILAGGIFSAAAPTSAQPILAGVGYLTDQQAADGSWPSTEVRSLQATTEALRALQAVAQAPAARFAATDFLELEPIADTDDLSRRIGVLAAEGRDVTALIARIGDDADRAGGWGLTPPFAADPLDTALALAAVAPGTPVGDAVALPALSRLLSFQAPDGGWPCARSDDADSEIFCTGHALLALAPYRTRFYLDPEIDAAADFLRAQLNADGSFGPPGDVQVIHTALASLALAAVRAFGAEVATIIAFLEGQQQADGSWGADPYPTALAVRALDALAAVPFCGNGAIDQASEACDGTDLGGLSCEDVGLGAGTLACSALRAMKQRWLDCAVARDTINARCWGGGDPGHQQASAQAWQNVGNCEARIALPMPDGCADPCPWSSGFTSAPPDALGTPPADKAATGEETIEALIPIFQALAEQGLLESLLDSRASCQPAAAAEAVDALAAGGEEAAAEEGRGR